MIIDIRGTHGSGKSHIVHQLISENGESGVSYIVDSSGDSERTIGTYLPNFQCAILGTYSRICGGCDGIKRADDIVARVHLCADTSGVRHVLLEGILVAHTFKRYNDLANEMKKKGHEYVFAFLDTPYDVCVDRVRERRVARGQPADFDLFHLTEDYKRCHALTGRLPPKFREAGQRVITLDHRGTRAFEQILALMKGECDG